MNENISVSISHISFLWVSICDLNKDSLLLQAHELHAMLKDTCTSRKLILNNKFAEKYEIV